VILAISGSLRRRSLNSAAIRAAAQAAARTGVVVELDNSARGLPHFDPDLEAQPPESVQRFRTSCLRAEAVLLAVPEYAFGIPGAFKNALDWTVGSGALYRKPLAVLSVAPSGRGAHVRRALEGVLTALDCDVSWHHVPIHPSLLDGGEIREASIVQELAWVIEELAARRHRRSEGAEPVLSP
jgi:chromate reductase, NAD(P)H dehydrogenase (quinone)